MTAPWTGRFVGDELGIGVRTGPGALLPVESLVGVALRRNPRRAHLLVSTVLAKHVPTEPGLAQAAGWLLGLLVRESRGADDGPVDPAAGHTGQGVKAGPDDDGLGTVIAHAAGLLGSLLAGEPLSHGGTRADAIADLGALMRPDRHRRRDVAVVGYAETATGLGRLVADSLGSYYIHSTRHSTPVQPYGSFEEAHSHATSHRLVPTDRSVLDDADAVVLVDDELSTGATVINTIRELHGVRAHTQYVVAALVDLRTPDDRSLFDALAAELGCRISVVAPAHGSITLPPNVAGRAADLIATLLEPAAPGAAGPGPAAPGPETAGIDVLDLTDADLTGAEVSGDDISAGAAGTSVAPLRSDRYGNPAGDTDSAPGTIAARLAAFLAPGPGPGAGIGTGTGEKILVLATEEFLAVPLAAAAGLQNLLPAAEVRYSSTTRSPIAALDVPGYAIRSALSFSSHDRTIDGEGIRFAYNISHTGSRFDTVIVLPEPGTPLGELTGPGSVTTVLAATGTKVVLVLLPAAPVSPQPLTGPDFGSYAPGDVKWLLTDLSHAALEAPAAQREAAIQSGRASYAESLPQEYEPTADYQDLFHAALDRTAARLAHAVGVVTEEVLRRRGNAPVLVSLARAGTPVGILMKRWASIVHGIDLEHYTMSIVRGLGMDHNALRYLAARHDPARIMFVDGWTGKGAIARELAAAVENFRLLSGTAFAPELAVLADPGHCVRIFGTREDYLIPSACLNSTVSGLVSRTVYNTGFLAPDDFHGAKFYAGLAGSDLSATFLEAVQDQFSAVRGSVLAAAGKAATGAAAAGLDAAREPNWSGWAAVEKISSDYGIHNVNLVKPGVGETTRVLLRRIPWKVLMRPEAVDDIAHVLLLARQRGVEVVPVPGLPYSCVGLIHPQLTPGATGADGKAVLNV